MLLIAFLAVFGLGYAAFTYGSTSMAFHDPAPPIIG